MITALFLLLITMKCWDVKVSRSLDRLHEWKLLFIFQIFFPILIRPIIVPMVKLNIQNKTYSLLH